MLSEKEKKLIQAPYFQVLRLIEDYSDDYVELKSACTSHCWAIRRKDKDVFLFHKHEQKHEYHNEYVRSISEAEKRWQDTLSKLQKF